MKKLFQVNPGKSDAVFPNGSPEEMWSTGLDEQAHWNEIDIRDAMFEAGCGQKRRIGGQP